MENSTKKITILWCCMMFVFGMNAQLDFTNGSSILNPVTGTSSANCAVDMNGDFLDDIVRVMSDGIFIDFQQADGTYTQTFFPLDVENSPNWSIAAGDLDGNGFNDLVFGNGSAVSFVMANEDGTAYTEDARPEYIFSQRSSFADIDNDGNLDCFVNHDVDQSHPYRNDGTGFLTLDHTLIEQPEDLGGNYAHIWCDYDNDGDTDFHMTKCRGSAPYGDPRRTNMLWQNNGDGTFTEVGEAAGMNDGNQSWTTVWEDFDNDGDFDAFTVNHSSSDMPDGASNVFMQNNGDGTFTDIILTTGIDPYSLGAWNCDSGDFDNNGFVDIFSEMSKEMWLNNGDGTFTSQDLSFNDGGVGDMNGDGFLDVIQGNTLWLNDGNDNNWVKIGCDGIISNKNGIGARIEIYGDWGVQIREVRSGESFDPMSSLVQNFGLGTATSIDQIIIKWPSGMITSIEDPEINQTYILPEAECIAEESVISYTDDLEICAGMTVELTAEVGESYTWSTGESTQSITVTSGGNYNVVVWNEEGCASISDNVIISVIPEIAPTIEIIGEEEICEGTSVVLSASGGDTYTWSNDLTGSSIIVTESGEYTVSTVSVCDTPLESEMITITVLDAIEPIGEDQVVADMGEVTISAIGYDLSWYETETSTEVLGTGASFTFELTEAQDSYWVEGLTTFGGGLGTGGKEDNSGDGGLPSSGGVLYFDAYEPFTLLTTTVYIPEGAGDSDRTFWVRNAAGETLQEGTFYLVEGENTVDMNFEVPMGTDLEIGSDENNMFRNSGSVSYPYEIADVGSINNSTFGGGYYYYFYDWQIQKEMTQCNSDRVEVFASVVGVEEIESVHSFTIFPNPASDQINLNINFNNPSDLIIEISDLAGKVVYSNETSNTVSGLYSKTIDVSNLATGMYQLSLVVENERIVRSITIE